MKQDTNNSLSLDSLRQFTSRTLCRGAVLITNPEPGTPSIAILNPVTSGPYDNIMAPREFLRLPHEIRHNIYRAYFTLDDGYVYKPESDKLVAADGFITPGIYAQIDDKFPWFTSGLRYAVRNQRFQDDYDRGGYLHQVCWASEWRMFDTVVSRNALFRGVNGSRYETSQAIKFALRLVAQGLGDDSNGHLARWLEGWQGREGLLQFLDQGYEPWDMPPISELESMGKRYGDDGIWLQLQEGWEKDRSAKCPVGYQSKHRFSATAIAIRFLGNLPTNKRSTMRELVLNEDHIAVGHQECHSHGLLALHKENPRLRLRFGLAYQTIFSRHQICFVMHTSSSHGAKT
ncbi:hypothetical protein FNYG_05304 [Fusarium nygamai]|uniref:Uncharacterized protein n=1 Tax=Gibberella nygamai TaxID=42673 RepID=A0A2K0WG65_GIBNY|nr:hypothetical protein FNYG_05304 [Fusarium nygamai]